MSNIMAFNEVIFPKIKKFYESSFKTLSEEKIDELFESSKYLNSELFESYLKKKLIKIRVIVRNGILYSGFDWYYITVPHGKWKININLFFIIYLFIYLFIHSFIYLLIIYSYIIYYYIYLFILINMFVVLVF